MPYFIDSFENSQGFCPVGQQIIHLAYFCLANAVGSGSALFIAPVEFESYGGSMDDLWKMYGLYVTVWMIYE